MKQNGIIRKYICVRQIIISKKKKTLKNDVYVSASFLLVMRKAYFPEIPQEM